MIVKNNAQNVLNRFFWCWWWVIMRTVDSPDHRPDIIGTRPPSLPQAGKRVLGIKYVLGSKVFFKTRNPLSAEGEERVDERSKVRVS